MNRRIGLRALVLVLGLAPASFGQGMGGGMMGGRGISSQNFGAAGADSAKASVHPVRIVSADGKTTAGGLRLTTVVVGCSFGIYEIKPEKVQEIRFGPAPSANMPAVMGQTGMQRSGQIVTTTNETIDGTVLIPSWWRVETDLGLLAPSPEAIKSITFLKKTEADGLVVPDPGAIESPPNQLEPIPPPSTSASPARPRVRLRAQAPSPVDPRS